jgi:hypothetical protein
MTGVAPGATDVVRSVTAVGFSYILARHFSALKVEK